MKAISIDTLRRHFIYIILFFLPSCSIDTEEGQSVEVKKLYASSLGMLTRTLFSLQNHDLKHKDHGAIWCTHCNLYHTRAAEAVYPLAYEYLLTENDEFKSAAIDLGNWLIRQQYPDGSWQETPEDWTGTSTDQLLMLSKAYPILQEFLTEIENREWLLSMRKAGDYLLDVMTPEFASINYVATTSATLMTINEIFKEEKYASQAEILAGNVIAKMDDDLFITGEGGIGYGLKYKFYDHKIKKTATIRFHDDFKNVRIIEPIILHETTVVKQITGNLIRISDGNMEILLELETESARMEIGNMDHYWSPYPALQAVPIIITSEFSSNSILKDLEYSFKIKTL